MLTDRFWRVLDGLYKVAGHEDVRFMLLIRQFTDTAASLDSLGLSDIGAVIVQARHQLPPCRALVPQTVILVSSY